MNHWIKLLMVIAGLQQEGLLLAQPQFANTEGIKRKWLNISYANVSAAQKLDIYLPADSAASYPVIISIHGGAFMYGDKADDQLNPMLEGLKRGYAVVSVNYRMSGEALFPADILDVKAAIRWVKLQAAQYKFKADKIAVWGGSAGGNLAALAGTSAGYKAWEADQLNNNANSRVQAVVDWFGPTDFLKMDEQLIASGNNLHPDHSEAQSPESKLLGQKITEIRERVKGPNQETYISSDDAPFLIEHGSKDPVVPPQQSENFAAKLEKVLGKEKITLKILQGAGHGGPQFETAENLTIVFAFLDKYLK
jgi:acetyl esterase/lipase